MNQIERGSQLGKVLTSGLESKEPFLMGRGGWAATPVRPFMLAITVTIAVVVIASAQVYVGDVLVRVERQAVATFVSELRAALNVAAVSALARRDGQALARLEDNNPLEQTHHLVAGEMVAVSIRPDIGIDPGKWVYDRSRAMFLYRYLHEDSAAHEETLIGYRARIKFEDRNGDGQFEFPGDTFTGVGLERVVLAYR